MGVGIETIFDLAFQDDSNDCNDLKIEASQDYFENEVKKTANVQKVEEILASIGIQVKNEYGNYRSLYDVLADIAERWEQMKV